MRSLPRRPVGRDRALKYALPVLLATAGGGCPVDDGTEYDQTFTVMSDVALSGTFETVEQGTGGIWETYPKSAYFFSTTADFEAFYTTLTGNSTAPSVDFAQYRAVAVVDADQPASGYSVEIVSVELQSGDQYDVTAHFTEPDGVAAAVLTKPYHIVKIQIQ